MQLGDERVGVVRKVSETRDDHHTAVVVRPLTGRSPRVDIVLQNVINVDKMTSPCGHICALWYLSLDR